MPDESGDAKSRDGGGLKDEGVRRSFVNAFNFHAASMAEAVGLWRSKAKINVPKKNQRPGGVSRTMMPGLAKLTPLIFSFA